jgi:AcrR family transcriptional regulator
MQSRGLRRVSRLLAAAVAEFAASGYQAATMMGIARRAHSPIGSLYQFFPNKDAVARALRTLQIDDIGALWSSLREDGTCASLETFVDGFLAMMVEFVRTHRAFVPLLDAPSGTTPVGARNRLRELLEALLSGIAPQLAPAARTRCAEVMLHVNKALMGLFASSPPRERDWILAEYRRVLLGYLQRRIAPRGTARHRRRRTGEAKGR